MVMASSDEDGEIVPDSVTEYYFVDHIGELVSFSTLPLQWNDGEITEELCTQIYVCGTSDDGLQQIYKKVIAWKFDISYVMPEVYVLSKDKLWVKLYQPRKSYEETIKTILITIHFLHFVKKNPSGSQDALWNQILKTFSTFEILPSENDLLGHMPLITEAALRDEDLARSEYMATFISKMHDKREAAKEDTQALKNLKFVIDDCDDDIDVEDDDGDEDRKQLFDYVCAYCDDGGQILCCEGRCIRSFHPTKESGAHSFCESLGYSHKQLEAIQIFLCKNCQYQQHQCFACGSLGSSNRSSGAEVFPCVSATCGHFYHPKCVSKLLHPSDVTKAEELCSKIAEGDSFTCPVHKCFECKQVEDKKVYELQFAICRRCPKAYHRKCLPRTIMFESDKERRIYQRAWENLLHNRVLIYCMDHNIIPEIGTPKRNHLVFPDVDTKKPQHTLGSLPAPVQVVSGRRSKVLGFLEEKPVAKMNYRLKGIHSNFKVGKFVENVEQGVRKLVLVGKVGSSPNSSRDNWMPVRDKYRQSIADKGKSHVKDDQLKFKNVSSGNIDSTQTATSATNKAQRIEPSGNAEAEKRVLALMKRSTASFNEEEFLKQKKNKSIDVYSKSMDDKSMTMGKVERAVKAVRTALKKLEDVGTIEEAKAVCEPEILHQLVKWRKLKVSLAPFLHSKRYTSFGCHFTKVDKLKEVVDRLRWYVEDGDTIVDFCCGSNDFSCLMKEALDKLGRKCSFKNYDIIQPKNAFSFEKRDWMSICQDEFPAGSNLIMGLNPPFGVHASLANMFISKALTFSPKLMILIVPKETKRLDRGKLPYDLIWEDDELLSGKSFYLPGSVDVLAQQMEQWNAETPPLYLWSRPDWTVKHKAIAREHGHISMELDVGRIREINVEPSVSNYLMEDKHDCYHDFSSVMKGYSDITSMLDDLPDEFDGTQPNQLRDTRAEMQFDRQLENRCPDAEDHSVDMDWEIV
ncbi:protein ENHANCED DOWNY MILDEW 2 isoform X2 [Coffea arabica]|uniref:Protein ENHANCED DOWNY MILDEW 2 isoform X2 n=1 Tax=Coffea arabica TaxID=13443 RepID=A0A6P6SGT3_COFAR